MSATVKEVTGMMSLATHNGTVTIHNPATGNHRTFRIKRQAEDANFAPGQRIVSLLAGPDNETDFEGFGFVTDDGQINLWRRKRTETFEVFAGMLMHPERFEALGAEFMFSGQCLMCNRKLTTPESVRSGIGPVCAEKALGV